MSGTVILVLIVAGVLVLLGVVMIVLAVVLGRKSEEEEANAVAGPEPERRGRTFIDEPLETDMSAQLGQGEGTLEPPAPPAPATAMTPPPAGTGSRSPSAASTAVGRNEGRRDRQAVPEGIRAGGTGPRKASYEFRVELGFRCLEAGEFARSVSEFRKAFALTENDEARTELLIEMGNVSRMAGEFAAARAAYEEAITYSKDPLIWDHLQDWIDQVTAEEKGAAAEGRTSTREPRRQEWEIGGPVTAPADDAPDADTAEIGTGGEAAAPSEQESDEPGPPAAVEGATSLHEQDLGLKEGAGGDEDWETDKDDAARESEGT